MADFPQQWIHDPQLRAHELLVGEIRHYFERSSSSVAHPGGEKRIAFHRTITRSLLGSSHGSPWPGSQRGILANHEASGNGVAPPKRKGSTMAEEHSTSSNGRSRVASLFKSDA